MAGGMFGLIHLTAACLLPAVGCHIDSKGGLTACMVVSAVTGLVVNCLWLMPASCISVESGYVGFVLIPIVLSGFSYALVAGSAWNGVFYLIEKEHLGTAQGVKGMLLSVGMLITPLMFGALMDKSLDKQQGYQEPITMQVGLSILSIVSSFLNYWYDLNRNKRMLSLSVIERNQLLESIKLN